VDPDYRPPTPTATEPLEVHQAAGMIAMQLGISVYDAYDALGRYADQIHWPMRAVAAEIVARSITLATAD
jgi:hypothetical protein